ncbi:MAG: hypothetical protein F4Y74_05235 [Gemmatimonadales bacterium]|nr:hypothetical protein [Gemmatimonadales bacterium]MYG20244.1 hypothetical protein [Gemmatimonadales bacterium]
MNERPILLHAAGGVYSLPLCLGLMLASAGGVVSQEASNGAEAPGNEAHTGLVIRDLESGDERRLAYPVPHDEVDSRTLRRAQWFHEDQHVFVRHGEFVRNLVDAGGKAGVGSHGQLQGPGYHWELWAMAADDMDEDDRPEELPGVMSR